MSNIFLYLYNFFRVQSIMIAASLVILSAWGMPVSYMSFVGNLLFVPAITVFLLFSSLIFITEVLCIPNAIIIKIFSELTDWWEKILSLGNKEWLMGIIKPLTTTQILIGVLILLIIIKIVFEIVSKFSFVIIIGLGIFAFTQYKKNHIPPKKPRKTFAPKSLKKLIIKELPDKTIKITDRGLFEKKQSPEKFVAFELKPYLMKRYGSVTIKKIKLENPTEKAIRGVKALSYTFTIKKLSKKFLTDKPSKTI